MRFYILANMYNPMGEHNHKFWQLTVRQTPERLESRQDLHLGSVVSVCSGIGVPPAKDGHLGI